MMLRATGNATLGYFYFDYNDEKKQTVHNAVTSLLIQFSAYSLRCRNTIFRLYAQHRNGKQQLRTETVINCLKEMITIMAQQPIFIFLDALNECPNDGMPVPREEVLRLVNDLVSMHLPNLHICVTSRPETDIQTMLKPLAVNAISLHDEIGQRIAISNYVSSVVSSDERMRNWRDEDRRLVVKELSERADGM